MLGIVSFLAHAKIVHKLKIQVNLFFKQGGGGAINTKNISCVFVGQF